MLPSGGTERIGLDAFLGTAGFEDGMKTYLNGLDSMSRATEQSASTMGAGYEGLNFQTLALANVVGGLLVQAFDEGAAAVRRFGQEALGAVQEYERLSLSLQTLIAREFRNAGAAKDMEEALTMVIAPTRELIDWVEMLAVKSPFDQAGIAAALRTAVTYGFVTQAAESVADAQSKGIITAQRLTQAMVNWSAGAGRSAHEVQRTVYAIGMMNTSGRVLQYHLRMLMTAGVDVNGVLREMGVNLTEVARSGIDAHEFIKKLVESLEKDFAGAAERQATTMAGLMESLKDLKKIMLREFFGPIDLETGKMGGIFGAVKPLLIDFVEVFTRPETLESVRAFGFLVGEYMSSAVEKLRLAIFQGVGPLGELLTSIKEMAPQIVGVVGAIGIFVGALIAINVASLTLRATWGLLSGTVSILASSIGFLLTPLGMVSAGIVAAATVILASVGKIRTGINETFYNTASDAYTWGENIVTSLANGMIAAIAAVLNALATLGNIIAGWLMPGSPPKLLPHLDKWGAEAMTEYMEGWKKGDFSVFNEISDTIESWLRALPEKVMKEKDLIPSILGSREAIARAIDMVREAGVVTDAAVRLIIRKVDEATDAFDDYVRTMLEMQLLTDALAAAQESLASADQGVADAQQNLNDVTAFYDEVLRGLNDQLRDMEEGGQEQARLAKIEQALASGLLTEEEKQRLEREKQGLLLRQQIRDTEKQRDAAVDAAQSQVDAAQEQRDAAAEAVNTAQAQVDAMQEQLDTYEALLGIQTEQNSLIKQQLQLLERLAAAAAAAAAAAKPPVAEQPQYDLSNITGGAEKVSELIDKFKEKIAGIMQIFEPIKTAWDAVGTAWAPIIDRIILAFEYLRVAGLNLDSIRVVLRLLVPPELWPQVDKFVAKMGDIWAWVQTKLLPAINNFGVWIRTKAIPALGLFWQWLSTKVLEALKGFGSFIVTTVIPAIIDLWKWINENLVPVLRDIGTFITGTVIPAFQGFWEKIQPLIPTILIMIGAFMTAMTVIQFLVEGFMVLQTVIGAVQFIIMMLASPFGIILAVLLAVGAAVALLAAAWYNNWGGIRDFTFAAIQAISDFISGALEAIRGWWDEHGQAVMTIVKFLWDTIVANFREAFNIVLGIVIFIWNVIKTIWQANSWWIIAIWQILWTTVQSILNWAFAVLGDLIDLIAAMLKGDWETVGRELREIWDETWSTIQEVLSTAWDIIKTTVSTKWEELKAFIVTIPQAISDIFTNFDFWQVGRAVIEQISDGFMSLWDWLMDKINDMRDAIADILKGVSGGPKKPSKPPRKPRKAGGGHVDQDKGYIVGEYEPEWFVPTSSGNIWNSKQIADALLSSNSMFTRRLNSILGSGNGSVTNIKNVTVTVNPSYEQVQSPSNIYYDVSAALASARL